MLVFLLNMISNKKLNMNKDVKIKLDEKIYSLQVIYGAAYVFIDRAYIFISIDNNGKISVRFRSKNNTLKNDIEKIVGEFENELLSYALRVELLNKTKKIREMIIEKALYSSIIE